MTSRSKVYFGSIQHGQNNRQTTLKTKVDYIIDALDFSTIGKKDKVAIKMHLGFNDGYQTVPVLFVRQVVHAVKDQGAYPFLTDNPTAVYNCAERGYTSETVGCPIIPVAGVKDQYTYSTEINYRSVDTLDMGGVLHDADALIDLTHAKGHGCNGYGGAIKNIALGAYAASSRWQKIHRVEQSIPYFNPDKCTPEQAKRLVDNCPYKALSYNEEKHKLSVAFCQCRQCEECLQSEETRKFLEIKQENFSAFQELLAIAAKQVVDAFDDDKRFFLNYMLQITPLCDCMGIPQPPVVNDIGVLGSRDIISTDMATLDLIKQTGLIPNSIPPTFRHVNLDDSIDLHPFQRLHGPMKDPYIAVHYGAQLGMGQLEYDLEEILAAQDTVTQDPIPHNYEQAPSFY